MELKAGLIPFGDKGEEWQDAQWCYTSKEFMVDVLDDEGNLVVRIDPNDLVAIADAVQAAMIRESVQQREDDETRFLN